LTQINSGHDPGLMLPMSSTKEAAVEDPRKLRELASWYREFAERAGNPVIWAGRVRMADNLDEEAERIERNRRSRARQSTPTVRPTTP
jgi:hypothetical protein